MATSLRKLIADENAFDRAQKSKGDKIFKASVVGKTQKRAALGELGNRALVPNSSSLLNKIKEATCHESLKNAKPKVDTHWKSNDGRKLIRTESLKSIKNTVNSKDAGVAVMQNKITLRSATTTTTKVISTVTSKPSVQEQKPAILKVTRQVPAKKEVTVEKSTNNVQKEDVAILRREESNLSRRSLTKLRAALAKDSSKPIIATKTEKGIVIRKKTTSKGASIENKIEKPIEKVKVIESVLPELCNVEIKKLEIEDIDANDTENIFALNEYVNDIYKYLNELEDDFKIEENFMKNQVEVTPRMRTVLLDWINEVAHQFRLIPETYQITVGIIDRYLQIVRNTTRGQLQLVGVTALFIATKYEELYSSEIGDFIYMTDNSYTKEEIIEMEKKIMRALDFQLSRPYPLQFLRRFSKAIGADQMEHLLAKYILELVSIEYTLAHYKPSEIAAAALNLSVQLLNMKENSSDNLWSKTVEHYSGYSSSYLKPIVRKIAFVLKNAPKSKNKSIYLKYKHEKYSKISTRPELYGKLIDSIIDVNY